MTQKDFSDSVARFFVENPQKPIPIARQLFQVDPIGENNGTTRVYQEYDSGTFASFKPEGANVAKTAAGSGYTKTATLKRYGAEIDITYEERRYNKYQDVFAKITNLTTFGTLRQELDLTHVFTFAGATSMTTRDGLTRDLTTGDGLSLVNASHTLAFSGVTYSNRLSGDGVFSETNLAAMELLQSTEILSNYGEKRTMNFNKLVVAQYSAVENLARQIIQSNAQISAPNAAVENVYKAKYDLVVLPYLATTATGAYDSSKKNYWFTVAAGVGGWCGYLAEWEPEHLVLPQPGNNLVDDHADIWTYGVRIGYDIAVVSGRGVIGSLNAT